MQNVILAKFETTQDAFYPPFGILYLADALDKAGYKIDIFHELGNSKNIQRLVSMTEQIKPLFIGFSVMTSPQLFPTIKASKLIKQKLSSLPVIWGGVHPTLLAQQCLGEDFIDMVIVGEGENTVLELAVALTTRRAEFHGHARGHLHNEKKLHLVKGLGYRENGDIRINEPDGFVDLNYYSPAWHLVNLDKYFRPKWGLRKVLPILISRGCPHRCGFCYNQVVHKRIWRSPGLEESIKKIEELKKRYCIEGLMFFDDSFFTDTKKALEIVKQIDLPWFSEIRADYVNEFLIDEIARYNCQTLYVGAESGSRRILDIIQKDIEIEDIIRCTKLCKKYNLELNLSFIAGIPGESISDTQKTMDLIDYLTKMYRKVNIEFKIFTPYPGTPLWERVLEYGLKEPRKTVDWVSYQRGICNLPWIKNPARLEAMCYACSLTHNRVMPPKNSQLKNVLKMILKYIQKIRWKKRFFEFPIEVKLISFIKSRIKHRI